MFKEIEHKEIVRMKDKIKIFERRLENGF